MQGEIVEYAECKLCQNGVLLPFTGPEGHTVYFCTNCRARFSGYQEEPMFEGVPVFSEMATYLVRDSLDSGETFTRGKLHDDYRAILDENPPLPLDSAVPVCDFCSRDLVLTCEHLELCWLPNP
ncbi:MAG: hypothetical protein ACMUHY_00340 [Thermoplasmatota archaeon]